MAEGRPWEGDAFGGTGTFIIVSTVLALILRGDWVALAAIPPVVDGLDAGGGLLVGGGGRGMVGGPVVGDVGMERVRTGDPFSGLIVSIGALRRLMVGLGFASMLLLWEVDIAKDFCWLLASTLLP